MGKVKATQRYLDNLVFRMLPEDGGQIVEVTYAVDEDGLWEQRYDRSDRSRSYSFAPYRARATYDQLAFAPQNSQLPRHNSWRDVVVAD